MRQAYYISGSPSQCSPYLYFICEIKLKGLERNLFIEGDGALFQTEIVGSLCRWPLLSAVSCFPGTRFHVPSQGFSIFLTFKSPAGEDGLLRNSFLTISWPAQVLHFGFFICWSDHKAGCSHASAKGKGGTEEPTRINLIESMGFRRLDRNHSGTWQVKWKWCYVSVSHR